MKSWKTTVAGIGMILGALGAAMKLIGAGNYDVDQLTVLAGTIAGGIGLICARDNNVTSEQAGAKKE